LFGSLGIQLVSQSVS